MAELQSPTEDAVNPIAVRREASNFRCCSDCLHLKRRSKIHQESSYINHVFTEVLESTAWKILIAIFTIVLLFGSAIQFLYTTKEADIIFDILYILVFIVFVLDMIMNMVVDPKFLGLHAVAHSSNSSGSISDDEDKDDERDGTNPNTTGRGQHQPIDQAKFCTYGIGSFNMWCDVVSTAALLYDISYTNPRDYQEETVELNLNQYGIATNLDDFNPNYPIEFNVNQLILVCKVARVARLIPSTKVVEISARINFYWYVERLNPFWYIAQCRTKRATRRARLNSEKNASGNTNRASYGGVEVAALAKFKLMAEQRRKEEKKFGLLRRTHEKMKRVLRRIGLLPSVEVEMIRYIEATKIQKAWRRKRAQRMELRSNDGLDNVLSEDGEGWRGRGSGTTTLERVLRRRNVLGNYHKQNGRNIRETHLPSEEARDRNHGGYNGTKTGTRADSQVGTAMTEVTGQWVAMILVLGLILTTLFTYGERNATRPSTMLVLHGQIVRSPSEAFAEKAVNTSVNSVIPDLYLFRGETDTLGEQVYNFKQDFDLSTLRDRERLRIVVNGERGRTEGMFENRQEKRDEAFVELLTTVFVLFIWFLGVTAFAGPVMTLVVTPIERMVRLLGMLMLDPLGYQTNSKFKKFMFEEDILVKKSQWTKEVLKGMETQFLMSTILRIGSLMKVGFGSAGVEIIRHNLQQGQNKNMLILNSQGSTVSCIFLFCDIRQFTDATECLQEEVFVFTNKIAAVVHSICHSYGGSANKNVGDAFLVSWLLEDDSNMGTRFGSRSSQALIARHNQADKALLSVVKICISLHYDDYYVETMSEGAKSKLFSKLENRPGPVVQMGFGLHAGKAVQGALGSERKIDATYVSEAVERAEFLESSTKQYGLCMLMSDTFYRLLHANNRRRCRKIDRIMFMSEDEENDEPTYDESELMELYTYDMDVDALWRAKKNSKVLEGFDASESDILRLSAESMSNRPSGPRGRARRINTRNHKRESSSSDEMMSGSMSFSNDSRSMAAAAKAAAEIGGSTYFELDMNEDSAGPDELILPTGPTKYSDTVWLQEDMRRVRQPYTSFVFQTFSLGLRKYYEKDWTGARQNFEAILERLDDGPSKYFLTQISKYNGQPPPDFQPFGKA